MMQSDRDLKTYAGGLIEHDVKKFEEARWLSYDFHSTANDSLVGLYGVGNRCGISGSNQSPITDSS
jgi:hypothetical protein